MYPISDTQTAAGQKLSYDVVKEVLMQMARKNRSQDKVIVSVADVQSELIIQKGIEASRKTIRDYGVSHRGYFEKKYSDACSYNFTGDTRYRGLVIEPEKFIEEVDV